MGQEAVHQLTPAPEAVTVAAADLGQPSHAALEGVAVQVGQARHQDVDAGVAVLGALPHVDRRDAAVLHLQADIAGPAVGQKGVGGMEQSGERESDMAGQPEVYAGNRANEFEQRLQGVSYAEIARAGGGIVSTVRATRAATPEQLASEAGRACWRCVPKA